MSDNEPQFMSVTLLSFQREIELDASSVLLTIFHQVEKLKDLFK